MCIDYYILNTDLKLAFAIGKQFYLEQDNFITKNGGHHVFKISETDNILICGVSRIYEKLIFVIMLMDVFICLKNSKSLWIWCFEIIQHAHTLYYSVRL